MVDYVLDRCWLPVEKIRSFLLFLSTRPFLPVPTSNLLAVCSTIFCSEKSRKCPLRYKSLKNRRDGTGNRIIIISSFDQVLLAFDDTLETKPPPRPLLRYSVVVLSFTQFHHDR